ncbi:MAG: hypothetical protein ABGZ35_31250 [Planctomycetaceae bacterium]
MLPRQMSRAALTAAIVLSMSAANAQFYGNGCDGCGPVSASAAVCTPIQPVRTTCYQQVPVTTYRREKQTVREPYYRTVYEDREVTVMKPVTTQREVEIPTVSYQNVTENRTVTRDMGRWITRYTPAQKYSPCQVDARPGVIGWLNRTGYSFRSAFRPNYYTARQYVPNVMACSVPVTRQVAVRGTRRVAVNETRMVAEKKTERVAVQKLEHRDRVVTVMRPQTAYRTVPIGSQLAYGYGAGYGLGSATAFAPTIIDTQTALNPEPDPISGTRSAILDDKKEPFKDDQDPDQPYRRSSYSNELNELEPTPSIDNFGTSIKREKPLIPAKFSRPAASSTNRWSPTSPKTAMRSSSQSATNVSQVTLTQKSEN